MKHPEPIPSLDELLHSLNLTGEGSQVECKESAWRLPADIWETVSAFSNTAGGTLLLGVAEREGRFEITGRVDNAAFRRLNHVDTLTASRALTRLESLGLLRRSEQRRGPGVYYTLVEEEGTPHVTPHVTPQSAEELPRLLAEGKRLSRGEMNDLIVALCAERPWTARELAQRLHPSSDAPIHRGIAGAPNDPNVAYRAAGRPAGEREGDQL